MNRHSILALLLAGILSITAFAQNLPSELTDAQVAEMISKVQDLPTSRLDRRLPAMRFADWLQSQAGPNGRLGWGFQYDSAVETPKRHGGPDFVEAHGWLSDGRQIIVLVAVGHSDKRAPAVYRIDVVTGTNPATGKWESTKLDRLRDLQPFLSKLREKSSNETQNE